MAFRQFIVIYLKKKLLLLDDDQFPAIGTGRAYIKEYIANNPTHNVIDALTYAIQKDSSSGYPIHASISSELVDTVSCLSLLTIRVISQLIIVKTLKKELSYSIKKF